MATWWRKPDGAKVLVLEVSGTRDGLDGYDCFAVDMDKALAQRALDAIQRFTEWHQAEPDLSSVTIWDYRGEYYAYDFDSEVDETPQWKRDDHDSRTECNRFLVSDGVVQWSAIIKHSDPPCDIDTEQLTASELQQYIDDHDPWEHAGDAFIEIVTDSFRQS